PGVFAMLEAGSAGAGRVAISAAATSERDDARRLCQRVDGEHDRSGRRQYLRCCLVGDYTQGPRGASAKSRRGLGEGQGGRREPCGGDLPAQSAAPARLTAPTLTFSQSSSAFG